MKNVICLNSNTYHGYSLEEAVAGARRAGVGFMEIAAVVGYTEHARADMTDEEIAGVLTLLQSNDIELVALGGHSNIMTPEGRTQFVGNLDLAVRLGVDYVVTGTGDTHDDEDVIEDEGELIGIVRELADEAASRGLRIAIETHGNNYGTGASLRDLVEKAGAANVGINYDTANVIFYGGIQPYDDLEASADRVIGIHLKDKAGKPDEWDFPAIGDGYLEFDRIFDTLQRGECTAPLSIEIEFTAAGPSSVDEVHEALGRSVGTVRSLMARN